jgi:hypothetical protein
MRIKSWEPFWENPVADQQKAIRRMNNRRIACKIEGLKIKESVIAFLLMIVKHGPGGKHLQKNKLKSGGKRA